MTGSSQLALLLNDLAERRIIVQDPAGFDLGAMWVGARSSLRTRWKAISGTCLSRRSVRQDNSPISGKSDKPRAPTSALRPNPQDTLPRDDQSAKAANLSAGAE